jgi:hypothetical protein
MIPPHITIENMSHLTSSFPLRNESDKMGYVDRDVDGLHPTQLRMKKIKLVLMFIIPGDVGDSDPGELNEEDQKPESLPRLASVRVPKGVPVAKVRPLIRFLEEQLQDIFGRTKRANFVLVCDEGSEDWRYEFELPTYGVVYV